jgi:hypothetical protein
MPAKPDGEIRKKRAPRWRRPLIAPHQRSGGGLLQDGKSNWRSSFAAAGRHCAARRPFAWSSHSVAGVDWRILSSVGPWSFRQARTGCPVALSQSVASHAALPPQFPPEVPRACPQTFIALPKLSRCVLWFLRPVFSSPVLHAVGFLPSPTLTACGRSLVMAGAALGGQSIGTCRDKARVMPEQGGGRPAWRDRRGITPFSGKKIFGCVSPGRAAVVRDGCQLRVCWARSAKGSAGTAWRTTFPPEPVAKPRFGPNNTAWKS